MGKMADSSHWFPPDFFWGLGYGPCAVRIHKRHASFGEGKIHQEISNGKPEKAECGQFWLEVLSKVGMCWSVSTHVLEDTFVPTLGSISCKVRDSLQTY